MIFTLVLSIAAGFAVPFAEPKVRDILKQITLMDLAISDSQYDMLTLLLLLLLVVVLCTIFTIPTPAFLIVLGAIIGVFGKQVFEALRHGTKAEDE